MVNFLKNTLVFSKIQEKMNFMNIFRPFQNRMGQPGSVNTILHEVIIPHVDNLPFSGIEVCQEAIMASYHGQQQLDDQEVIPIPPMAVYHGQQQ